MSSSRCPRELRRWRHGVPPQREVLPKREECLRLLPRSRGPPLPLLGYYYYAYVLRAFTDRRRDPGDADNPVEMSFGRLVEATQHRKSNDPTLHSHSVSVS